MNENGNGRNRQSSDEQRIDVFFTPDEISEDRLKNYSVVVVDVLRAATSITTALENGARYVIPVPSIDEATSLAAQLSRDGVLLCGEREGKIIEGFNVGNSPADYTRERVRARLLIFGSTNGSPAVVKASVARSVHLCGFINLNAVADAVTNEEDPFPLALVCAGKQSRFAVEDAVCAGILIERLKERNANKIVMNDAAKASEILSRRFGKNILRMLKQCDHGKYLIEIGMGSDLPLCAADSEMDVAPVLRDGKLIKHSDAEEADRNSNGT